MSLAHGGHLTHGASVNISGKLYNAVTYGLDENEVLDYAEVERLALEHKPKMIVAGASAYALQIDWAKFREIADKVGAYLLSTWRTMPDWLPAANILTPCHSATS